MYRRIVISFCLAVAFGVAGYAAPGIPVADTLDVFDDAALYSDLPKDTAKVWDRGFDVRNYLNSTRYRIPGHTIFNQKSFFSNTFVGVRGSVVKLLGEEYGYGPAVGGVVGKWLNPAIGIRLGADIGYWKDNFDARKIRELGLSADVMFNLMSHLDGYNTARFFEISMVAGLGLTHVWKTMSATDAVKPAGNAISGRLGLNLNMRVFDRLHLYLEPQIDMYLNPLKASWGKGLALSEAGKWNAYTRVFNTTVGLTYNFGQTMPEVERLSGSWRDPESEWNGYFLSVLGGSMFLFNSPDSWASDMATAERFGTQFSVGGGRWFNDYFALRLSAAFSKNNWLNFLSDRQWTSRYISLRLDGMVDVLNLGRRIYNNSKGLSNSDDPLFGLSILAGPEMGQIVKVTPSETFRDYYVGVGAGLQARLRVLKWLTLLAEPRYTFVPYSTTNTVEGSTSLKKNYRDGLMSVNLGLEARIPSYHYLLNTFRAEREFDNFDSKNFFSNTFIGVRGTTTKLRGANFAYGPAAGGVIGKWVHPAVGIRLGAGLGYWYDNYDSRRVRDINLTADVMFNLMAAIGGYNPARFVDLSLVAGAGLDHVWKSVLPTETARLRGNALSGHVGLNIDMKVFDNLSLFVEPQAVLYIAPSSSSKGITLSDAGKRYTLGSNTSVGLAYNFGQIAPEGERLSCSWKDAESESKGYFVSLMGGAQTIFNSGNVWKADMTMRERFGTHVSVGGGRWFNDIFALRLSASYSRNNSNKAGASNLLTTRYMNLRLEGMLDLMKLGGRLNHNANTASEDSFFGLALLAGPEVGHMLKQGFTNDFEDHYVGLTGGLQARFRVHKWLTLLAEPRGTLVPYSISKSGSGSGPRVNRVDGLMSFNAGLELLLPNLYPILYKEQGLYEFARGNFFDNTFIGARGSIVKLRGAGAGIGQTAGAFVGKWVHPVLAVRLGAGMGYWYDNNDARRVREIDLSADLMLNMTTALGGYNPARFFEASLVGGVGMTHVWKPVVYGESARKSGDALSGRLGLNFDMKVLDRTRIFVEPMVSMYVTPFASNKGINLYGSRYTFGASGSVGMAYNFRQTRPEGERLSASYRDPQSDWNGYFVSVLGGTQLQFYPGITGMSGAERAGMHFSFGGGRWFNDYLGLRFSASYSRNNWIKYGADNLKSTRYSSLRLEGMLDIFNLCRRIYGSKYDDSYGSVPFFGLSLLAGPEMGHMLKQKYTGAFSDHYVGAVGGLQARFRVHKLVSVLAEPRVTIIPYSMYTGTAISGNRIDGLMSFNAGLEVRIPTYHGVLFDTGNRKQKAVAFEQKNFLDKTFAGVRASTTTLFGSGFGAGQGAGIFAGSWVHPIVGVRIGAGFGYWFDNSDARRVREIDLSADLMFNMMSAIWGFDSSRFCDVSLVAGAGYNHVWKSLTEFETVRAKGDALSGRVGVNVDMKVSDRIHLFLEPQAVLYLTPFSSNKGIRLTGSRYGIGTNTSVGLTYNFGQTSPAGEGMTASWKNPQSDWDGYFVSFLGGVQYQLNGIRSNMTAAERAGVHVSVGAGRWLNDFFGLRVTGSYSRNNWVKYGTQKPLSARYGSMRLEGMLDVLNLGTRIYNNYKGRENVSEPLFGLSVLAGPEVGHVLKRNRAEDIRSHYVGFTGGLQARVRVNEWVSVLAEPRMSILPYSVRTNVARANSRDALVNLNLGLEVRIPKTYSLFDRSVDHSDFNKDNFFSNTFAGARAGSISLAGTGYGQGQMAGVFAGKWVHPVVGIRLGTGLGYWYSNSDSRRVREFDLAADAMFNMMSAFGGYSTTRFCEVSLVAGAGYTHVWKSLLSKDDIRQKGDALSGRAGVNIDMKILDKIHLFVEPQAVLYLTAGASNKGAALTGRRFIFGSNTSVGLTYNFGQTTPEGPRMSCSWNDPKSDWNGYFASALGGCQFQCNSTSNMTGDERTGMYISLGGGRWFNDIFGLRVSGSFSRNNWKKYEAGKLMNAYYLSMRLEGMLDVLSVCRRIYNHSAGSLGSTDRFFGLSVLAGPELGYMKKRDVVRDTKGCYVGLAGGLQARFRVNEWISVLAEPRVTIVPHSAPNNAKVVHGARVNTVDGIMSFNAGLEIRIPTFSTVSR